MKRTIGHLAAALALALVIASPAASDTTYRVGFVGSPTTEGQSYLETFRGAMRALGYVESNLILDVRMPDRDMRRLPAVVDELIALKPDVLVGTEKSAQVMRTKTTSIPIVLANALDPVRAGLARSLRQPGMNVTGSAQLNDLLPAKHIEIMREILPRLTRVGQLVDTTQSGCRTVEATARQAAHSVGAVLIPYYVETRADIERAFSQMAQHPPQVLLPCPSAVLFNYRDVLFENAARLRIPLTSFIVAHVPDGVLLAYAADIHEMHRRAATYVDLILKGARPGNLPIEQPTKFDLVINMKTARALGVTIPPAVLLRAERVID